MFCRYSTCSFGVVPKSMNFGAGLPVLPCVCLAV